MSTVYDTMDIVFRFLSHSTQQMETREMSRYLSVTIRRQVDRQSKQKKWSQLFWMPNCFRVRAIFSKQIQHVILRVD